MESAGSVPACVCAQVDMWTVTALGLHCFTCEFRPVCVCVCVCSCMTHKHVCVVNVCVRCDWD